MNMYPPRNKYYSQLPPKWRDRIAGLRLLTSHNASVHEIVRDKTISTLNICSTDYGMGERIVEFFSILQEENYCDFNLVDKQGWCALLTAIRTNEHSIKALSFLKRIGVDFSRIMDNGRTALHWAAEMAIDVATLENVFSVIGSTYLNQQDRWGWTPLHYAIVAEYHRRMRVSINDQRFAKATFLLERGADENIKANRQELLYGYQMPSDEFTPLELSKALRSDIYRDFIEVLKAAGRSVDAFVEEEEEEDEFHDAFEEQPSSISMAS